MLTPSSTPDWLMVSKSQGQCNSRLQIPRTKEYFTLNGHQLMITSMVERASRSTNRNYTMGNGGWRKEVYPENENLKNNRAQKSQANPFVSKLEFPLCERSRNNPYSYLLRWRNPAKTSSIHLHWGREDIGFHCYSVLILSHGCSTSTLLTFGTRSFVVGWGGAVLCIIGCLAAFLVSTTH